MENSSKYKLIVGTVISKVIVERDNDQYIEFQTTCGVSLRMHHIQDCCEQVYIEDIVGDIQDLVGEKILSFEEKTNSDEELYKEKVGTYPDSITWTFYTIRTINTTIDIRWLGESNGHYSEGVYFSVKYLAKSDGELNKMKNVKKESKRDVNKEVEILHNIFLSYEKYLNKDGRENSEELRKTFVHGYMSCWLDYNKKEYFNSDSIGRIMTSFVIEYEFIFNVYQFAKNV